jgi:hypothetical protein
VLRAVCMISVSARAGRECEEVCIQGLPVGDVVVVIRGKPVVKQDTDDGGEPHKLVWAWAKLLVGVGARKSPPDGA